MAKSITIDLDGVITGQFSNAETIPLAQVGLANFPNVEGLVAVGNNNLIESRNSGQALIGQARTGNLGAMAQRRMQRHGAGTAAAETASARSPAGSGARHPSPPESSWRRSGAGAGPATCAS